MPTSGSGIGPGSTDSLVKSDGSTPEIPFRSRGREARGVPRATRVATLAAAVLVGLSLVPSADSAAAAAATAWPDFDGVGGADRGVFRPSGGGWYINGQATEFLGVTGDVPVPADYDGDGVTERAVFRDGAWFIEGEATRFLGRAGDLPVPGDYDGDGTVEPAIFRDGAWFVDGQPTQHLGLPGDVPVPADYDGDGSLERAVFRPSHGGWYVQDQAPVFYGLATDVPVPADYDGDGTAERAVYRPAFGGWYVEGSAPAFYGLPTDVPVPADYDGDGTAERAVYRPAFGGWFVQGDAPVFYGTGSDIPLPLPAAVYVSFFAPTSSPDPSRFPTLPVGAALPSGAECAAQVRTASEIRPENATANNRRGSRSNANTRNDWAPFNRVDGDFAGTTDEIIQWAACKWGIDEDIARAQVIKESYWYQSANGDNGESWGLGQVRDTAHQSAFQYSVNARTSSAYNLDYTYASWRACYEGVYTWLNSTAERNGTYAAGDEWGCVGVWFSGRWYYNNDAYLNQPGDSVRWHYDNKTWQATTFVNG